MYPRYAPLELLTLFFGAEEGRRAVASEGACEGDIGVFKTTSYAKTRILKLAINLSLCQHVY